MEKLQEFGERISTCHAYLKSVEDQLQRCARDAAENRSTSQILLPLSVVRASRIAVRSTDLEKEEKQAVIRALEEREAHIASQIDKLCSSSAAEMFAAGDLKDIPKNTRVL